jgi:hypothetical protein
MVDSPASGFPLCPLCGAEILSGQELSKDHVFGRALGGHITVIVHKTCNNQIGSAAEGNLQRPNTVINLMKAGRGLDASPIPGTFPSGRRAELDLKDGNLCSPPVLLRDGGASDLLEVSDFTQILLQPAIDALQIAADNSQQPGS